MKTRTIVFIISLILAISLNFLASFLPKKLALIGMAISLLQFVIVIIVLIIIEGIKTFNDMRQSVNEVKKVFRKSKGGY